MDDLLAQLLSFVLEPIGVAFFEHVTTPILDRLWCDFLQVLHALKTAR